MLSATLLKFAIDLAQPMQIQDVIGAECAIDKELATPVTIRMLLAQKV
jgi:hypothetical protein